MLIPDKNEKISARRFVAILIIYGLFAVGLAFG